MNRRVLLVDLDPAFSGTLTRLLNRYRVVVMHEPEAERALAIAAADPPALIIIGVDEPDKAGFRVFQKTRKGALGKVPTMLVTSSLSADAFAKHRGLKVHADDYLDKREADDALLVSKVDALIQLGEPEVVEESAIAVDDDIPMDEGDVVLDEVVGDDAAAEFDEHNMQTAGPDGIRADSIIGAETDAAFDALLGGDEPAPAKKQARAQSKPAPEPVPEPVPEPIATHHEPEHADAVPEPVPHHNKVEPEPMHADAVPEPVPHHNAVSGGEIVDASESLGRSDSEFGEEESPVAHDAPLPHEAAPEPIDPPREHARAESVPAIELPDDDLVPLDEEIPLEDVEEVVEEAEPAPVAAAAAPEPIHAVPEPVPAPVAAPPPVEPATKSGSHPAVDLGLDAVAEEADREQSGIYDRKAIRKIGELERQITQMKTELERARAATDAAAKGGREAQFLNLREANIAKDKELKQAKAALDNQTGELEDLREKVKVMQHAKTVLEQKNGELEQRIFDSGDKTVELTEALKAATDRTRTLEDEITAKQKALAAAESQRAQLEQDLATERATGAASASEAERTLRLEREQLIQRHQAELAKARDEGDQATETALARQKEELDTAHGQALHEAVEELRKANAEEMEAALAELEKKHSRETVNLKADQAGTLSALKTDLSKQIEELKAAHAELSDAHAELQASSANDKAAAIEELTQKHQAELAAIEDEHTEARERDAESMAQQIATMKAQLDRATASHEVKLDAARRELEALTASHEAQKAQLAQQHEAQKAQLVEQHEAALGELQGQHEEDIAKIDADRAALTDAAKHAAEAHRAALADAQAKHEAEVAEIHASANREVSELKAAIAASKRAADEAAAARAAAIDEAAAAHAKATADAEAKHERALALANGDFLKQKSVADAEHARTLAAEKAAAEAARSELEAAHARVQAELGAERDELKKGLSSTRDQQKRTDGELASAVQTIAERNSELRQHQAAIVERDNRIAELRKEIEALEAENASYQDQVLRAYQKIKADEAMVARARKAMAIALTVLDDEGKPPTA